jgi:hypothetical protein
MGGVYNAVNLHLYHYAGNNPVKYTDPDGRIPFMVVTGIIGAVAGAGISIGSDVIAGRDINWGRAGGAAAVGALAGLTLGASAAVAATATPLVVGNAAASFGTVAGIGSGVAATGSTAVGLSASTINYALQSTERIQHASAHLVKGGILPNWNKNTMAMARELYTNILSTSTVTFDHVLRDGKAVKGFLGQIDGKNVAVYIYKTGEMAGQIATSVIPSAEQLLNWGIK